MTFPFCFFRSEDGWRWRWRWRQRVKATCSGKQEVHVWENAQVLLMKEHYEYSSIYIRILGLIFVRRIGMISPSFGMGEKIVEIG